MKYLITIIGPTAIGKTSVSIALAQHYNCEIISCDSRQFFKEMTIGTAVPSKEELAMAVHHFIQNKSIFENYSVGDFEKEALSKINELHEQNDFAILVGGSGLYVDAVLKGLDYFPPIDKKIKEKITAEYQNNGIFYLQNQLEKLDPDYFKKLTIENPQTLQNPQRLMRFVEVCIGTGKSYSSFLNQQKQERSFIPIIIGLDAEREIIYNRINQRVATMINDGLLDEVKKVYPHKNLNALQTVGYQEIFDYLDGKITLEFAIEEIKKNSRRFAKRQLTWFKRTEKIQWFDYDTDIKEIINHIDRFKTEN